MKIYYDADCGICNKCKNFVTAHYREVWGEKLEFLDMNSSIFSSEIEKTIVVLENNVTYRYGKALRCIFKKMSFPFFMFAYLPIFILTFFYLVLREARSFFSKKICKI